MSGGQQAYWDSVAGQKQFTIRIPDLLFRRFFPPESRILDFGCGYGRTLAQLAHAGYSNLYGVDFSDKMIALARRTLPAGNFTVNHDTMIPFADAFFDGVILIAVLTAIIPDNAQKKLLREIYRGLKPGGMLFASDFLLNTDGRNLRRYEKYAEAYHSYGVFELDDGAVLRHHRKIYIEQLFSAFECLHREDVIHHTMNGHQSNGFIFIGRKHEQ